MPPFVMLLSLSTNMMNWIEWVTIKDVQKHTNSDQYSNVDLDQRPFNTSNDGVLEKLY